jgi:hypothetical protein
MVKEIERVRGGLSRSQKTDLVNRLFYAGFNVDGEGFVLSACSGDRPRRHGHDLPSGYIGRKNDKYYAELRNLNQKGLAEDHIVLRRVYRLV